MLVGCRRVSRDVPRGIRPRLLVIGLAVAIAAAGAALLASTAGRGGGGDVSTGDSGAVAAEFELLDGGTATFASYRGTPLVVNFFASWCPPCVAEMPDFELVHQDHAAEVAFVGLNLQDGVDSGRRLVEQTGVTYDVGRDPDGTLFQAFGGIAMPTTVFIDADGQVVEVHSGALSADALQDRVAELLSP